MLFNYAKSSEQLTRCLFLWDLTSTLNQQRRHTIATVTTLYLNHIADNKKIYSSTIFLLQFEQNWTECDSGRSQLTKVSTKKITMKIKLKMYNAYNLNVSYKLWHTNGINFKTKQNLITTNIVNFKRGGNETRKVINVIAIFFHYTKSKNKKR